MQVNVHQAKTQLSKLLEQAERGEDVVIARGGKPIVRLVLVNADLTPREFGRMRGVFEVPEDFDDPLPPDLLAQFNGE